MPSPPTAPLPGRPARGLPPERLIREELDCILGSGPFRHSYRSQHLLRYLVERTLAGDHGALKQRCIGVELFGRQADYDTAEDAIVRVAANDLRNRLAEFYAGSGDRLVRISVPAGSYVPELEVATPPQAAAAAAQPPIAAASSAGTRPDRWKTAFFVLLLLALAYAVLLWMRSGPIQHGNAAGLPAPAWPLSRVMDDRYRTTIVVADSTNVLLGMLRGRPTSLQEYLQPGFLRNLVPPENRGSGIGGLLSTSALTSYADVSTVQKVMKLAGSCAGRVDIRFARELRLRELQEGNFIFLGSPASNPWVSLFAGALNFHEQAASLETRVFVNRKPRPGERKEYRSFSWSGSPGEEFATIALVPTETRRGSVLIIQGLHQEGTEAAGALVASEEGQRKLRQSLGIPPGEAERIWFEALVRAEVVAGAASSTQVVAARISR